MFTREVCEELSANGSDCCLGLSPLLFIVHFGCRELSALHDNARMDSGLDQPRVDERRVFNFTHLPIAPQRIKLSPWA